MALVINATGFRRENHTEPVVGHHSGGIAIRSVDTLRRSEPPGPFPLPRIRIRAMSTLVVLARKPPDREVQHIVQPATRIDDGVRPVDDLGLISALR